MNTMQDLEALATLALERQAEMRWEARTAALLRGEIPGRKEENAMLKRKLLVAVGFAIPAVLLIARAVAAAGGGGGPARYLFM